MDTQLLRQADTDRLSLLVVVPLFLAYVLGSFSGLRVWLAVQSIPAVVLAKPKVQDPTAKTKKSRRYDLVLLAAIAASVLVGGMGAYGLGTTWIEILHFAATMIGTYVFVCLACADVFSIRQALHRDDDGALCAFPMLADHTTTRRVTLGAVTGILSIGLSVGAFYFNSALCASVVLFAALYAAQGQRSRKTVTMRKVIIGVLVTEIVLLAYIATVVAIIVYFTADDNMGVLQSLSVSFNRPGLSQWLYVFLSAIPLSQLLAITLRLDYANHILKIEAAQPSGQPASPVVLEVVPVPEKKPSGKILTTGVIVPSRIPGTFARPYFASALSAWLFANFAVTQVISIGLLPEYGRLAYAGYVFLFSTPLVVLTIVGVSMFRGEAARMWKYEEVWTSEPTVVEEPADRVSQVKDARLVRYTEQSALLA